MSTAQEPRSRWAFFAHHMLTFVVIGITLYAVADLTGLTAIGLTASLFLVAFMVGEYAATRHTGLLCPRCIDAIPADGQVQAERRDWALRLTHWTMAYPGRTVLAVVAVWAADLATPGLAFSGYILWPWWGVQAWALQFHNRVIPWCPYCRDDDGGHEAATPTPDPAGAKTA